MKPRIPPTNLGKEFVCCRGQGSRFQGKSTHNSAMAYELYYHKPNSQKLNFVGKVDNCDPLNGDIKEEQYMAVFKSGAQVVRYFVTREAGPIEVIALDMEDEAGRFNKRLSNLVNFVTGSMECPRLPGEESEDEDEWEEE